MRLHKNAANQTEPAHDVGQSDMASPFTGPVRVGGIDDHADGGDGVGNGKQNAVLEATGPTPARFESLAQEGHQTIIRAVLEEIDDEHHEDAWMQERLPD